MDNKIDDAIAAKKEQVDKTEKKLTELRNELKRLMEKKKANFCNELIAGLADKGMELNNETIQNLLKNMSVAENMKPDITDNELPEKYNSGTDKLNEV